MSHGADESNVEPDCGAPSETPAARLIAAQLKHMIRRADGAGCDLLAFMLRLAEEEAERAVVPLT